MTISAAVDVELATSLELRKGGSNRRVGWGRLVQTRRTPLHRHQEQAEYCCQ